MYKEIPKEAFLKPDDLVEMGLFKNTGQVFRAVKTKVNIPPHVRVNRKTIRFPREEFCKWLSQRTEGANNDTQCTPTGGQHE